MPIVRKRRVARRRRPARRVRKAGRRLFARTGRSLIARPTGQYGTVTETISLPDLSGNAPYHFDIDLQQFPRSTAITAFYQFYRLKYVEFKYIPKYPMGTQVAPGETTGYAYGRPMRLYYMMNRLGTEPLLASIDTFIKKGCKPIPFGDSRSKAVVVKYKPNLMSALNQTGPSGGLQTGTAVSITPVFNKWVNRWCTNYQQGPPNPNYDLPNITVDYEGHLVWIDDFNLTGVSPPNDEQLVAEVRVTAVWEYKNPYEAVTEETNDPNAKVVTEY